MTKEEYKRRRKIRADRKAFNRAINNGNALRYLNSIMNEDAHRVNRIEVANAIIRPFIDKLIADNVIINAPYEVSFDLPSGSNIAHPV